MSEAKIRKVRIEVTEDDIEKGKKSDGSSCPVALALKRATGYSYLHADYRNLGINGQLICTPTKAEEFMRDFDSDSEIRPGPFSFEIELETWELLTGEKPKAESDST